MTDFDLERLGDMWRQDPDPAEIEKLRRTADRVARHARRAQFADAAFAILVSIVVLILAISNPRPATLLIGGAAIALMLGSSIRQRKLRALELKSLTGTAEQMLDQSIARAHATLKRVRTGLLGGLPGVILGLAFGAALESGSVDGILADIGERLAGPHSVAVHLVIIVAALYIYLFVMMRRSRRELKSLTVLRDAYRREDGEPASD
ncbi:hypothetical protein RCO27_03225 [Sphingosinicella sp. LHD-64]|uniref:hypothetical protein n=1 Tax=Sphingosinicella sp. LHD-64 TaxID=3072139 RepID=UPI00280C5364|nr:hypothetical protein [Sphingosinicella sp. LHD-64]MDQ8755233.1 hypothetical protein [Sphingosinicella sp. LHD-64]